MLLERNAQAKLRCLLRAKGPKGPKAVRKCCPKDPARVAQALPNWRNARHTSARRASRGRTCTACHGHCTSLHICTSASPALCGSPCAHPPPQCCMALHAHPPPQPFAAPCTSASPALRGPPCAHPPTQRCAGLHVRIRLPSAARVSMCASASPALRGSPCVHPPPQCCADLRTRIRLPRAARISMSTSVCSRCPHARRYLRSLQSERHKGTPAEPCGDQARPVGPSGMAAEARAAGQAALAGAPPAAVVAAGVEAAAEVVAAPVEGGGAAAVSAAGREAADSAEPAGPMCPICHEGIDSQCTMLPCGHQVGREGCCRVGARWEGKDAAAWAPGGKGRRCGLRLHHISFCGALPCLPGWHTYPGAECALMHISST